MLGQNTNSFAQSCLGAPQFIQDLGFDPSKSALSSKEDRVMGVTLIELNDNNNPNSSRNRTYQDPTWDDAGYLGTITRDRVGNLYMAPKAKVNILHNPHNDQNSIYMISTSTGKLSKFMDLPLEFKQTNQNPFGLLGAFYDCETDHLIVSTISGSDQNNERGIIYAIDIHTKKIKKILSGIDALSVGIITIKGQRKLIYGNARNSEIWSINIDYNHKTSGKSSQIIDLTGYGYAGDYKAKKIQQKGNKLYIQATIFQFSLSAGNDEQSANFVFRYENENWIMTR